MDRKRASARLKNWWLKYWRVLALCGGCLFAGFLVGMLIFGSPWHRPAALGDIPTWITAFATIGLLIGAIFTARYAIRAFREQSKEVADQAAMLNVQSEQLAEQRRINEKQTEVLELQATELRESIDDRKREAEQRHRAQASLVFITQERAPTVPAGVPEPEDAEPFVTATVHNTGDQPLYDAELRWHLGTAGHGEPNPDPIGTILPRGEASKIREFPASVDLKISGAVVRFTDAAGVRWLRRPDGYLNEFPAT